MDFRLIVIATAALVVHLVLAMGFKSCNSRAGSEHESAKLELAQANDQALSAHAEELQAAMESKYHVNDLDLIAYQSPGIEQTIAKLLDHMIPQNRKEKIEVTVDRFTAFRVYVKLSSLPKPEEMALWMKELFSRVDPKYVIEVIITDGADYKILDYYQLNDPSLDWSKADALEIAAKFFTK